MRALVCGAGIAGLSLTHELLRDGWDVTVVEKEPGPRSEGYMVDFFGLGHDAADRLGILPRLRELAYDVDELVYVDELGRRRLTVPYSRLAQSIDGRMLTIMRPDLELALREAIGHRAEMRHGCTVSALEHVDGGVRCELSDGEVLAVDLLVGADGIHSGVRRQLLGPEHHHLRHLGLHTAAFLFADDRVRAEVDDRLVLTDTTDRMIGFYGLRDGRVAAFTVHRNSSPALPADPRAELCRVFGSMDWVVPAALERCPPPDQVYYDQVAQVDVPRWHHGRVVLIGDACQAVSLVAGQGASLAMAGAAVLASHLRTAASVDEALVSYQDSWRPVVQDRQRSGRAGLRWFLPSSAVDLWVRRAMLRLSGVPAVNRVTTRAAIGRYEVRLRELDPVDQG